MLDQFNRLVAASSEISDDTFRIAITDHGYCNIDISRQARLGSDGNGKTADDSPANAKVIEVS